MPDLFSVVGSIVSTTMSIVKYFQHRTDDVQCHYLSSLATVSRVLNGIALATKDHVENKRHFVR